VPIELTTDYDDPRAVFHIKNMKTREMNRYNAIVTLATVKPGAARADLATATKKADEMTDEQIAYMAHFVTKVENSPYPDKPTLTEYEDIKRLLEDMPQVCCGELISAIMNVEALEKLKKVSPSSSKSEKPDARPRQRDLETCGPADTAKPRVSKEDDTAGTTPSTAVSP